LRPVSVRWCAAAVLGLVLPARLLAQDDVSVAADRDTQACLRELRVAAANPATPGAAPAPTCDAVRTRLVDSGLTQATRVALRQALAVQARQQRDAAAERAQWLAALAAAPAGPDGALRWPALAGLARHFDEQRVPGLAVLFGKLALQAQGPATTLQPADRQVIPATDAHRQLAQSLAEAGRVDEAVAVLALLKQHEFADYAQGQIGSPQLPPVELSDHEQDQARRWASLPPLARARAAAGSRPAGAEATAESRWAQDAQALLQQLASEPASPAPLARGRAAARGEPALQVHLVAGEERLTMVLRAGAWMQVQAQAWPRRTVQRDVGAVLARLARGEAAMPALQALHHRLGAPIEQAARSQGLTRVVVQADAALRYLPLAALHDGTDVLGARLALLQQAPVGMGAPAPAAAKSLGAPAPRPPTVKALGVSRAISGFPALQGVAQEICSIVAGPVHGLQGQQACAADPRRGVVPGEAWMNERFTAQRLVQSAPAAAGGAWLHVGTHFDLRPGQMSRSSLLLGDGAQMSLQALAQLDFSGQALVTLSACETALGGAEDADGREVEGLNLLLLQRGAAAVLASLWRVDDRSTAALMTRFYEELSRVDPARALQRAQAAVRATPGWEAPLHWAGFQLTVGP
jgi:CHAT domain-containing protein